MRGLFLAVTGLVLMGLIWGGCSSGPRLIQASREVGPPWLDKTPFTRGEARYYVGRAIGAVSADEAFRLATAEALRSLVQELGVTVSEESHAYQEERDGKYSYDVQLKLSARSEPVKLREVVVADRYTESWRRQGTEHDGWVLVEIPLSSLDRARREAAGRVLLVFECRAQPSSLCEVALAERVRATLTEAGRAVLPGTVVGAPTASLAAMGLEKDAAFTLHLLLEGESLGDNHGEFFASGSATVQLVDTGDDKTVVSVATGPVKGGHFSRNDALKAALKAAVEAAVGKLRGQLGE